MALPAVERRNFKIGKYDIVAQPNTGSAHMLRYTVMLNGSGWGRSQRAHRIGLPLS